jgi:hypothetical protein
MKKDLIKDKEKNTVSNVNLIKTGDKKTTKTSDKYKSQITKIAIFKK